MEKRRKEIESKVKSDYKSIIIDGVEVVDVKGRIPLSKSEEMKLK